MRWFVAISCVLATGCASIRDAINYDKLYGRMRAEARDVWRECEPTYAGHVVYPDDFEEGFKDGYVDFAMGSNGCPPTLPDKEYWHARFRDLEGKERIGAWYNGHAAGVLAARSTGAQDRNRIPTAMDYYGYCNGNGKCQGVPFDVPDPLPPPGPSLPVEEPPSVQPASASEGAIETPSDIGLTPLSTEDKVTGISFEAETTDWKPRSVAAPPREQRPIPAGEFLAPKTVPTPAPSGSGKPASSAPLLPQQHQPATRDQRGDLPEVQLNDFEPRVV